MLALIVMLPSARYFIHMSSLSDFDFLNIFIQSAILKTVVFGVGITVTSIVSKEGKEVLDTGLGLGITLILTIITYIVFGVFMIVHKFATRRNNIRFFLGLVVSSFCLRIVTEVVINAI